MDGLMVHRRRHLEHSPDVRVEVVTVAGHARPVDFRVLARTVEVWHLGQRCGVLSRAVLATWLRAPDGELENEEVTLYLDRLIDREDGRVAVSLPEVCGWALSPSEQASLTAKVVDGLAEPIAPTCELRAALQAKLVEARSDCRVVKDEREIEWLAGRIGALTEILAML